MKNIQKIQKFISKRPTVLGAYGYGSGVFQQSGYQKKDHPQIDLILVVKDLKKWHLENMKLNPKDYSWLGKLFFRYASLSQLKGITGITYLSNITENGAVYKYGTIEEKDLIHALDTWESFYLPGRFQKVILPIVENKKIEKCNQKNRKQAFYTALLTLPVEKKVQPIDIYTQICGLSYLGDTRMKFAENPRKVLNIVEGSFQQFHDIYGTKSEYCSLSSEGKVQIDTEELWNHLSSLPSFLYDAIQEEIKNGEKEKIKEKILSYFTNLNKKESTKQTIKGIFTNGIVRSIQYAFQKVKKKIRH